MPAFTGIDIDMNKRASNYLFHEANIPCLSKVSQYDWQKNSRLSIVGYL
jgi:hypothetical protein